MEYCYWITNGPSHSAAGDVVRFADGDLHGFRNASDVPFVYLSVTAPPVNFREAYSKDWSKSDRRSY